jgi:Asp-tRNA(Asn)/Glu-tRNA(Gln) amidotransferase A subunit family amidase
MRRPISRELMKSNSKGPKLHAVLETNTHALQQAAALDAERKKMGKRSPLHGIPVLLKDNIATLASEGESNWFMLARSGS